MKQKRVMSIVLLTMISTLVIWPLWFIITQSITQTGELTQTIGTVFTNGEKQAILPLLPTYPTLAPIAELLLDTPSFFVMFWNSCKITFPQVVGQLLVGAPAAWAFSRFRFRGKELLFGIYILLMLMPFQVTMVPNYLLLDKLGAMDTRWAIILPAAFSTFPIFIMRKGFDAVPLPLLEAAKIDGASYLQIFVKVGIPLGVPGILSAMVLGFLEGWNMLEQPMLFLENPSLLPLSLYLPQISADNLSLGMVASFIFLLPTMLIFLFGQKYLELGIQSSGIKE